MHRPAIGFGGSGLASAAAGEPRGISAFWSFIPCITVWLNSSAISYSHIVHMFTAHFSRWTTTLYTAQQTCTWDWTSLASPLAPWCFSIFPVHSYGTNKTVLWPL